MTTREQAIEIAAMDRAKRCDVNWDRLSEVGREAQRRFHAPTIDALLVAGVIPAEGMVAVDAARYGQLEAIREQTGRFLALTCYGPRTSSHCGPNTPTELARYCPPDDWQRIMRGMARAYYNDYDDIYPGDLDAIPDAPTGEHAGIP